MFERLFNVFSNREKNVTNVEKKPLTDEFRNRVLMLLRDSQNINFNSFLTELHKKVSYLYGKFNLTNSHNNLTPAEDLLEFFTTCSDENCLDIIELIFRSDIRGISWPDNKLIPDINHFFRIDALPYHLTNYSTEEFESSFFGTPTTARRISEYPTIIRKDSELIHQNAMNPALILLRAEGFKHANDEFIKALEDHRKGDYRDCLTKCGSAFESVMKVLCAQNSIPYNETDTASVLLKKLFSNASLDQFWEQPLTLISTIRNRLSSSHGAGAQAKVIPIHVATYAVNSTASAILLLCNEFGINPKQ